MKNQFVAILIYFCSFGTSTKAQEINVDIQ